MDIMLPLTVKITVDKNSADASFVAYNPEFDVASCGSTEEKARANLHEAIRITLDEVKKKHKLKEFLEESGFYQENKKWVTPRISFDSVKLRLS